MGAFGFGETFERSCDEGKAGEDLHLRRTVGRFDLYGSLQFVEGRLEFDPEHSRKHAGNSGPQQYPSAVPHLLFRCNYATRMIAPRCGLMRRPCRREFHAQSRAILIHQMIMWLKAYECIKTTGTEFG